jgi:aquaporin Z
MDGKRPSLRQRFAGEIAGTFILTLVAAGADVTDAATGGGIGHVARYLAPGLVLVALIFSLAGVSGAHLNPAVTLAFVVRGVFPARRAVAYVAFQLLGAVLAGIALRAVFGALAAHGANHVGLNLPAYTGALAEVIFTAILVFVILATCEEEAVVGKNAAIAVGFTVVALGLFGSPISGASMNPARSLGPALATATFADWWVYLAGPLVGALMGVAVVRAIFGSATSLEHEAAHGKRR